MPYAVTTDNSNPQDMLAKHFQAAVRALQYGRYERALGALHQVLQLAPNLPEAHVNMGFTLLALERGQAAIDFFSTAIQLKPSQVNAYYGLALAHEAINDLPAALGAMRSYVHLTQADDPRLPKARAAIWEWDMAQSGKSARLPEAATPEPN
jgi:tetratricopeptide (TPR) repeat protein